MKKYLILILAILSFTACEKAFLGEKETNNPENNFEIFWNDFNDHYALFGVRGWDWDSVYTANRPKITAQTTDDELFQTFKEMVAYLDDSHTFVASPTPRRLFVSGSQDDAAAEAAFSRALVKKKYVENVKDITYADEPGYSHFYGKMKNRKIGYVYFQGIDLDKDGMLDEIMNAVIVNDAIIIDLRNNTGGDDTAAQEIAGRFADEEKLVYTVEEKNGPGKNDFAKKKEYFTVKTGKEQFTKPVIILTDKVTVSAAEVFLLYMKAFDNVTQMGDATSGDFSDTSMRRFLPNGFQYQYSIMKFLTPDGKSLDGIGHVPDIFVKNTEADIKSENDKVLEKALQFLKENHGIN